jgi:hypothetical protein
VRSLSLYSASGVSKSFFTAILNGEVSDSSAVVSDFFFVVLAFVFAVTDLLSAFFFFVPAPKRLSRRLSNRDFLALEDVFVVSEDVSGRLSAGCGGVSWDCCSCSCCSVECSFFGAVQKMLSRNQIFLVCLLGSGVKLTKPPLVITVV